MKTNKKDTKWYIFYRENSGEDILLEMSSFMSFGIQRINDPIKLHDMHRKKWRKNKTLGQGNHSRL